MVAMVRWFDGRIEIEVGRIYRGFYQCTIYVPKKNKNKNVKLYMKVVFFFWTKRNKPFMICLAIYHDIKLFKNFLTVD